MKWFLFFSSILFVSPSFTTNNGESLVNRQPQISAHNLYRETDLAQGVFLVASEKLLDPNFRETVILILDYGRNGARGIIINRKTEVDLARVFQDVKTLQDANETLFLGGPVAMNQVYLLARSNEKIENSTNIVENVYISSSYDVLSLMIEGKKPENAFRAYSGFAGWAPGQLENEIHRGDWRIVRANTSAIFDENPDTIWSDIMAALSRQWI
ncbi:UPF0301 protein YqgE [hydrothermal vent metagenome]|uniref:UPF0301 protein YqgE n=1 Tax=hydrothermal vent metagenome TaxID=652676 RepID=A0A3B1BWM3_9ZZZZ